MDELEIEIVEDNDTATLNLKGRITNTSAPYLERMVGSVIKHNSHIVLECTSLDYISSAGLRVLKKIYLWTQAHKGSFVLKNINEMVREVLDMVGLSQALTIE